MRIGSLDGLAIASRARSPEGGGIDRCVGDVETDAVDGQQTHPFVKGRACSIEGNRAEVAMNTGKPAGRLPHDTGPQPGARSRRGRLARGMVGIQRQEQGPQGANDLSPDGRYVQVVPDPDGDGQPDDRRSRQTSGPYDSTGRIGSPPNE